MRAVSCILVTALALAAEPNSRPANEALNLRLSEGRPVVTGVFVNGVGPFQFLLDTGAELNSISEDIAEDLRWKPAFAVELVSVHGVSRRDVFVAARVTLGSVQAEAQKFVLAPEDEMDRVARDLDGVLGQAFLSAVDYRLDIARKELILHAPEVPGVRMPFERSNGRMLLATNHGRLVLDSGTDVLVLRKPGLGEYGRLHAATGTVLVRSDRIDLTVSGLVFRGVTAAFVLNKRADPGTPDGLLPLSLLGSIYVSNSGGYVVIGPLR